MTESAPPPPRVPPVATSFPSDAPHAAAGDDEVVYYEGSPLLRGELGTLLLWGTIGLILIAAPVAWWFVDEASFSDYWWAAVASFLIGLVLLAVPSVLVRRTRYRVTNYRIDYERGLLSKSIDTLELWHVNDIRFRQSFVDRVFGVGSIVVDSDDRSTPHLELKSVADPRPLYDQLKQRVIAVKRQRGVIKMDTGG